eukprot:4147-Pyramimonas_sp.AAC.1
MQVFEKPEGLVASVKSLNALNRFAMRHCHAAALALCTEGGGRAVELLQTLSGCGSNQTRGEGVYLPGGPIRRAGEGVYATCAPNWGSPGGVCVRHAGNLALAALLADEHPEGPSLVASMDPTTAARVLTGQGLVIPEPSSASKRDPKEGGATPGPSPGLWAALGPSALARVLQAMETEKRVTAISEVNDEGRGYIPTGRTNQMRGE